MEQHRNSPIERYDVCYFKADSSKDALTPAYVDLGTMTAYRWHGVVLQSDQIPRYYARYGGGSFLIFPKDPSQSKLKFENIDPPAFYMLLPDGKYAAGYFDAPHYIYYRWGKLEFDKSQLPADAASKDRILPFDDSADDASTITPPSQKTPPLPNNSVVPRSPSALPSPSQEAPKVVPEPTQIPKT